MILSTMSCLMITIMGMLDFPSCKPLIKKNTSMIEHINGVRIYIPYDTIVYKKGKSRSISNNFFGNEQLFS